MGDGKKTSDKAMEYLIPLVKPEDVVIVLAVAEDASVTISTPFDTFSIDAVNQINENIRQQMKVVLKQYGTLLKDNKIQFKCLLGNGCAKDIICHEAEIHNVDLIVLGRREYMSGFKRTIVETHSAYVAHNAHCAVLIVKDTAPAEQPHQIQRRDSEELNLDDE